MEYIRQLKRDQQSTYAIAVALCLAVVPSMNLKLIVFPLLFLHEHSSTFSQMSASRLPANVTTKRIQIKLQTITMLRCFITIIQQPAFHHRGKSPSVFGRHATLLNKATSPSREGGGGVLPYMGYTGTCRWIGLGFWPLCPEQGI